MWQYQKHLEFPVNIKNPDPKMAKLLITQYGGSDGELGAALRYLSQRFTMPTGYTRGLLTDIGTEELAHLEIIGTMCTQLLDGATCKQLKEAGYDSMYVEHGVGVYPSNSAGVPFTAAYISSKGDPVTDLTENLAAEQKAKQTYEYLLNMADDPDVIAPLRFLREREVVHLQRFGEALHLVQELNAGKKC